MTFQFSGAIMKIKTLLLSTSLFLAACSGQESSGSESTADSNIAEKPSEPQEIIASSDTKLSAYMTENSVCDVLNVEDLKQLFGAGGEIEASASAFRSNFTCNYTWERPDAAEREKIMMENIMAVAKGEAEKIPMRQKMMNYQLTVTLSESNRTPENFMPPKLTEEQLQARIKQAKELAAKRLTDEQKALAGESANNMIEGMMKQNNQNQMIEGIGEAAYWTEVGSGGLYVLTGQTKVFIGPMIADTESDDLVNAKEIAALILE